MTCNNKGAIFRFLTFPRKRAFGHVGNGKINFHVQSRKITGREEGFIPASLLDSRLREL